MKSICKLFLFVVPISMNLSCKKNDIKSSPTASLNVVNAVVGGGDIKLNSHYWDSARGYNSRSFSLNASDGTIRLYSTGDSLKPYYVHQHQLKNGGTYCMFLFGNSESPESIFAEENIPAPYADSLFGVRIINLALGGLVLNVTRESDESTNIFREVGYKQMTGIVTLPLPFIANGSTYAELRKTVNFQIRDAGGVILATYQLPITVNSTYPGISINLQRFKNITLVVKGIAGVTTGPDAFGVFPAVVSY